MSRRFVTHVTTVGFDILILTTAHAPPKIKIAINVEQKGILLVFASNRKMSVTKDLKEGQVLRQNQGLKVVKEENMHMLLRYRKTQMTAQIQNMRM